MATTMSDLNNRVATLEGKSSTTPITMSDLQRRIEALEARPVKDFAFETLSRSSDYSTDGTFNYPSKYQDYDFILVSIEEINIKVGKGYVSCGQKSLTMRAGDFISKTTISFSKNSSSIVASKNIDYQVLYPSTITVLFYK